MTRYLHFTSQYWLQLTSSWFPKRCSLKIQSRWLRLVEKRPCTNEWFKNSTIILNTLMNMYCLYLLSLLVIKTKHIIGKLLMFFFYMHIFTSFNNFVAASMSIQIFHLDLVNIRKNKANILLKLWLIRKRSIRISFICNVLM